MAAQTDTNQQILSNALGGQFDWASFYRAKKAGYSDTDIVNAMKSAGNYGVQLSGQGKYLTENYDRMVSNFPINARLPQSLQGTPRLLWTPNSLIARTGQGARTGADYMKGFTLSQGTPNLQIYLNEEGWKKEIDTNPEVNYRYNTGDSLDPGRDIDNQYGRLAEMDLAGLGGSEEYGRLARERAKLYNSGKSDLWGSAYLHETNPRAAAVQGDAEAANQYFLETNPEVGTGRGARLLEEALAGKVFTPLATTGTEPGTTGGMTSGATYKNIGGALSGIRSTGQRLGAEGLQALSEKTGKGTAELVRGLRARNLKTGGEKGGLLTAEARQMYREATGKQPKAVAPAAAENRKAAKSKAERVIAKRGQKNR
jgi:hypothetical protein